MKYLFEAVYKDDSSYKQTQEDKSVLHEAGSCFTDVIQDEVSKFSLVGEHTYLVNLDDGHFEIDGVSFAMHEEKLEDFRLVFWRRHTHSFNQAQEELAHDVIYRLGWQANDKDGKNIQRVMEIN